MKSKVSWKGAIKNRNQRELQYDGINELSIASLFWTPFSIPYLESKK